MTPEQLKLADKIEGWSPEKWKPLTLNAHERRLAVAALRATPDMRVREALAETRDALSALKKAVKASQKMNGREYIGLGIQVNNALDRAHDALSRQPGTGEAEPGPMTLPYDWQQDKAETSILPPQSPALGTATVEAAFLNLCEALGIPATAAAYLDAPKARAALAAKEGA